jgi:Outer membrane lipoprotein carrier protein LolA-like
VSVANRKGQVNFCVLLIASLFAFAATPAWSLDIESVLKSTTITPPARVGFREIRQNPMFKENLVLTGYLEYLAEGQLRKVVETPFQESYLITADSIEIERDGNTKVLSLNKSRSLRTMLGGIEAILAGHIERLESAFDHELSGTDTDWALQLSPRSRRVARQLKSLRVTGDGESVTSIRFDLKGDEWHMMEIQKTPSGQ